MVKGKHPNSIKALEEATEKRRKPTGKRVNVFLTPEAIASGTAAADSIGISRSELIEQLLRKGEVWLIEQVKELELMQRKKGSNS